MQRTMLAAAAAAVVALPAAATAQSNGVDLLAGTGERAALIGGTFKTHVNAIARDVDDAKGHFHAENTTAAGETFTFRGDITCLSVIGNKAMAGGVVTESNAPRAPVGTGFLIQVTDNGAPGRGSDTNINFIAATPEEVRTCPHIVFNEIPITKGNFVVQDASDEHPAFERAL